MYNTQQLKRFLVNAGYPQQINYALWLYLIDNGYSGQLNQMLYLYLGDLGYVGQMSERLKQWASDNFIGSLIITAISNPTGLLFEGDNAQDDLANFSTFNNTTNYESTAGTISSVDYQINSTSAADDDVLAEDDVYSFLVTDSVANEREFVVDTAEYLVNVIEATGNEVGLDINPNAPDVKVLGDIVIDVGSPYDDTYSGITAGELRDAPYNFGDVNTTGLPTISGTTGFGDTLTVDEGLWSTPDGTTLTFSYQWQSDGVDISGATSTTFDITASEQGTDVTCEVTGTDGTENTTAETAATAIPAATPTISVSQLGATKVFATVGSAADTATFSCGDPLAGKKLVIHWSYGVTDSALGDRTVDVTVDAGAGSVETEYHHENQRFTITQFSIIDASAGGDIDISASLNSGNTWAGYMRRAFLVSGQSSFAHVFDDVTGSGTMDLSASVIDGGYVIGCSKSSADSTTAITLVGLDLDESETLGGTQPTWAFSAAPTTTETRTMTVSHNNATGFNTAAALVIS